MTKARSSGRTERACSIEPDRVRLESCFPDRVELQVRGSVLTGWNEPGNIALVATASEQETGRDRGNGHETHTKGADKRLPLTGYTTPTRPFERLPFERLPGEQRIPRAHSESPIQSSSESEPASLIERTETLECDNG